MQKFFFAKCSEMVTWILDNGFPLLIFLLRNLSVP